MDTENESVFRKRPNHKPVYANDTVINKIQNVEENRHIAHKLTSAALFFIDFGSCYTSGNRFRHIFICLSFLNYNVLFIVLLLYELLQPHELQIALVVTLFCRIIIQLLLWKCLISRGKSMRCIIEKIQRIKRQTQGVTDVRNDERYVHWVQVLIIVTSFGLPLLCTLVSFKESNAGLFFKYFRIVYISQENHSLTYTALFLLSHFMEMYLLLADLFGNYFAIVCLETRGLLSGVEKNIRDRSLSILEVSAQYESVMKIQLEAESLLNFPAALYTARAFYMFFLTISNIIGSSTVCSSSAPCIFFWSNLFLRMISFLTVTYSAAEFHQQGKSLKLCSRSLAPDIQNQWREGTSLQRAIEKTDFSYTGYELFRFTRTFVLTFVGTALTYSLLFLQLRAPTPCMCNCTNTM